MFRNLIPTHERQFLELQIGAFKGIEYIPRIKVDESLHLAFLDHLSPDAVLHLKTGERIDGEYCNCRCDFRPIRHPNYGKCLKNRCIVRLTPRASGLAWLNMDAKSVWYCCAIVLSDANAAFSKFLFSAGSV